MIEQSIVRLPELVKDIERPVSIYLVHLSSEKGEASMIPGIPQVGGMELLILLAIILLFLGARRVPKLGRTLRQSMREFRKGASEDEELPPPMRKSPILKVRTTQRDIARKSATSRGSPRNATCSA